MVVRLHLRIIYGRITLSVAGAYGLSWISAVVRSVVGPVANGDI